MQPPALTFQALSTGCLCGVQEAIHPAAGKGGAGQLELAADIQPKGTEVLPPGPGLPYGERAGATGI